MPTVPNANLETEYQSVTCWLSQYYHAHITLPRQRVEMVYRNVHFCHATMKGVLFA